MQYQLFLNWCHLKMSHTKNAERRMGKPKKLYDYVDKVV